MKRIGLYLLLCLTMLLCACGGDKASSKNADGYTEITAEQAKSLMDTEQNYRIVDVRTPSEYEREHIPGAILIPDYSIEDSADAILLDKQQLILVYCRSGRRSKNASAILARLGYTNVMEFGGIIDWPYEVVTE